MVDAEGVAAEGSVGLTVFKGLGLPLGLSPLGFLSWGRWFEGVIIQVPRRWREVPVEGWRVEVVVAVSAVG